jgi:hypothetical protein
MSDGADPGPESCAIVIEQWVTDQPFRSEIPQIEDVFSTVPLRSPDSAAPAEHQLSVSSIPRC